MLVFFTAHSVFPAFCPKKFAVGTGYQETFFWHTAVLICVDVGAWVRACMQISFLSLLGFFSQICFDLHISLTKLFLSCFLQDTIAKLSSWLEQCPSSPSSIATSRHTCLSTRSATAYQSCHVSSIISVLLVSRPHYRLSHSHSTKWSSLFALNLTLSPRSSQALCLWHNWLCGSSALLLWL